MKQIRWIIRALFIGVLVGFTSYILSFSVGYATSVRTKFPYLVLLLPLACLLISLCYNLIGTKLREFSNNAIDLINEKLLVSTNPTEITSDKGWNTDDFGVPVKLAPLVFATTFIGHLCGASVGKEGAGVQIGIAVSSIIYAIEKKITRLGLKNDDIEIYLITGAGAAFGSLFSAPIAGTLFGLQFAGPKYNRLEALLPCLISSFLASFITLSLGMARPAIAGVVSIPYTMVNILWVVVFGILLGLASSLFLKLSKWFKHLLTKLAYKNTTKKVMVSFIVLILYAVVYLGFGSNPYVGLSAGLINQGPWYGAIIKLVLTSLCLACGFTGGEVVPSLVIGASLLRAFGFTGIPLPVLSVLGAVGFLSGATALPVVCFALCLELFGTSNIGFCFLVCAVSYLTKFKGSIYENQI